MIMIMSMNKRQDLFNKLASESLDSIREASGCFSDVASSYSTMSLEDADAFSERLLEAFEYVDSLPPSGKLENVRDEILDALVQITSLHALPEKSWDKLTEAMDRMSPPELEYALSILGNTHDSAYIPIIEKYSDHPVEFVRKSAEDALKTLRDEDRERNPIRPVEVSVEKELAWIAFVCGLLTNVVLYFAPQIGHAMHNDSMPLVFLFLLYLCVFEAGIVALWKRQRLLPILGILLSLPSLYVFLWIVFVHIIPFYVRWFNGEVV